MSPPASMSLADALDSLGLLNFGQVLIVEDRPDLDSPLAVLHAGVGPVDLYLHN